MSFEDVGDAYMNHAGGGMYGLGSSDRNLNNNLQHKVVQYYQCDNPNCTRTHDKQDHHVSEVEDQPKIPTDTPTRDEISRVMEWWYNRRDRIAEMFEVSQRVIPASVVWFLDIDHVPTARDIERGREIAKELGLLNET